jgi:hypothetical protein
MVLDLCWTQVIFIGSQFDMISIVGRAMPPNGLMARPRHGTACSLLNGLCRA